LTADILMLLEMACNRSIRGKALLTQAKKVIGKVPASDEV
jgi:hypothetical protein